MGTLLQAEGLAPGELPERWNITHAENIIKIHRDYYNAGSNLVNTNTFGANILKFGREELDIQNLKVLLTFELISTIMYSIITL